MSFLNDAKDFCYMQPGIPQETLEKVAELVGFDGNLGNVQLIELTVARFWGVPFKMARLVTQDMAYFKYPMHDAFTLKLHSDTDIRFDAACMEISFNGQKLYTTSSNETFGFLKALIAKLPASDKSIISQFERIAAPRIYSRGQIPEKKLQAALAEYSDAVQVPAADDIIMLIDDTFKEKVDKIIY